MSVDGARLNGVYHVETNPTGRERLCPLPRENFLAKLPLS
ncbi:hypothetical protein CP10881SC42_0509 [Chlamydia avium]|uniref:Uncharacterized protein n=1 Tax=Chlamydia avium TaxID=1457141 RepID=A0ABP2X6F6_9CHLA|nr:hypothetical protein CP10743SC13_0421 [Chlamydia psittaci 10_743_SC13]EPP38400.1 hypothetical protein CP10881SC42_0509 [Chlamydia avium]